MNPPSNPSTALSDPGPQAWRGGFLRCLLVGAFFLFFQAYMIAPLIPYLAQHLHATRQTVGLAVPAYLLPYALGTFAYGALADRHGRRTILFTCLAVFAVCCGLTSTANSAQSLILWRCAAGCAGGGIAVMTLTLIGDLYQPEERGAALGWLFGAIAGGSAFGSTLGGVLTPLIGWRGLFLGVSALSLISLVGLAPYWSRLALPLAPAGVAGSARAGSGYFQILAAPRARATYSYILFNGIFHSGVFTWLGSYLSDRYHLGETGIGLALLGYGIPGFLLGPVIGKYVDRFGRGKLLPWGLAIAAVAAAALIPFTALPVAALAVTLLSLGFDTSHPLLAGIVTGLAPAKRAQAMALNTFTLFLGFAGGSFLFGTALQRWGFATTLSAFAALQLALAAGSVSVFRGERGAPPEPAHEGHEARELSGAALQGAPTGRN